MTNARTAYRESNVHGASALRLVVLLYDQIIHDLAQAEDAIEHSDIERRTKMLNHAVLVIGHLQSPLDFVQGGKVATDLDHFYNVLRHNLVRLQFHPSIHGVRQQITDVQALREAWVEVERRESSSQRASTNPPASPAPETAPLSARVDWKG